MIREDEVYDLVGIGAGPSNLSIAVAAHEIAPHLRVAFFDAKESFVWHEGLMFDGAEMQVTFTKDLVTLRNPASEFSFLKYLQARGRLSQFINLRTFYPTRTEFNDYYGWVAEQFAEHIHWGQEVMDVHPVSGEGAEVQLLRVVVRDRRTGDERSLLTRNLVHAPGGEPTVPAGTNLGRRVWHASETRERLDVVAPDPGAPYHFNIVGGGQTSADVFLHVRATYPNCRITHSLRSFALQAEDDTHFVNEFFDPDTPDWFFGLDPDFRQRVLDRYSLAAHSGVSADLIPQIYRAYYEDRVAGHEALTMHRFHELVSTEESAEEARATYVNLETGAAHAVTADAVIVCTGYEYPMPVPVFAGIESWLEKGADGRYLIGRGYDAATSEGFGPRVFLQGYAERTHGFTEVLLSLMPLRAAEIVGAVDAAEAVRA